MNHSNCECPLLSKQPSIAKDNSREGDSALPVLYHVTPTSNLESIKKDGLIPQIGERSKSVNEEFPAIYLFSSTDDVAEALMNWLGEELEDEEITALEIRLPKMYLKELNTNRFEVVYQKQIPPQYIQTCDEWDDL